MLVGRERGVHDWFSPGKHSYEPLLESKAVKDWISLYQSVGTRTYYLRCLEKVVKVSGFSPDKLLQLSAKEAKRVVFDAASKWVEKGNPCFGRKMQIAMKSFYYAHDVELMWKRNEIIHYPPKKISVEVIPDKAEVYRMVDAAETMRNKAVLLCLFQSGVRVNCLCRWTYGMFKDQLYPEMQLPIRVKVTASLDTKLSGYGLSHYYTFLQAEAATALKEYLEHRKLKGWKPQDTDLIFVTEGTASWDRPLRPMMVWEMVKYLAEKVGLDKRSIWVHCFRKSFRKVLNATQNAKIVDEDFKEAVMGHKLPGSRGNYYDYHDVDEAAQKYMRCCFGREESNRLSDFEAELQQSRTEIERLKTDLALAASGKIALAQEVQKRAFEIAEVRQEIKTILQLVKGKAKK